MKSFFQEQFRYNQWANEKLLAFTVENNLTNNRVNPIFSHLTMAQVVWRDRLQGNPTPEEINEWTTWPWAEIEEKCNQTNADLLLFVNSHPDDAFDEKIKFTNSAGVHYTRQVRQVLSHVLQYTNFHRGQVVGLIHQRENIITPNLDFIDFANS